MRVCVCVCQSFLPHSKPSWGDWMGGERDGGGGGEGGWGVEVRWGVSGFRQWLRVRGRRWMGGECVHVCV